MKLPAETQRLLDELLSEGEGHPPLLERTLREVRRRREVKARRRSFAVMGVMALATALLVWRPWQPRPLAERAPGTVEPVTGLAVVHSAPLPAETFVQTVPGWLGVIRSARTPAVITTRADRPVPWLDDSELFGLLAGRPAAIVRPQEGRAALLLLDPAEQAGLGQ